jgi:hypothetical protein
VFGTLALLHEVQRVLGLGLLLGDDGATNGHDEGDDAVDALGALVLGGLEINGRPSRWVAVLRSVDHGNAVPFLTRRSLLTFRPPHAHWNTTVLDPSLLVRMLGTACCHPLSMQ